MSSSDALTPRKALDNHREVVYTYNVGIHDGDTFPDARLLPASPPALGLHLSSPRPSRITKASADPGLEALG